MEPIVSHQEEKSDSRKVAVLLDGSASMGLSSSNTAADAATKSSRGDTARHLLLGENTREKALLDQLQADYDVHLYEFAANAHEVEPGDWRLMQGGQGDDPSIDRTSSHTDWNKTTEKTMILTTISLGLRSAAVCRRAHSVWPGSTTDHGGPEGD